MTNEETKLHMAFERRCFIAEMICLALAIVYFLSDAMDWRYLLAVILNYVAWLTFWKSGCESKRARGEDPYAW